MHLASILNLGAVIQCLLLQHVNYFYIAIHLGISSDHLRGIEESVLRYAEFKYVLNLKRYFRPLTIFIDHAINNEEIKMHIKMNTNL